MNYNLQEIGISRCEFLPGMFVMCISLEWNNLNYFKDNFTWCRVSIWGYVPLHSSPGQMVMDRVARAAPPSTPGETNDQSSRDQYLDLQVLEL